MRKKNRIWGLVYKLHRYAGLLSAIVLLMLATTGIILNHTDDLKLDSKMVHSPSLLNWYGIQAPKTLTSYATKNHWISLIGQQLYFDKLLLETHQKQLLGVIETADFIVIASKTTLSLVSSEGDFIESIPFNNIEKIGVDNQAIVIKSKEGFNYSDDSLITWKPFSHKIISWSTPSQLPSHIAQNIKNQFRSTVLPFERVILDIHSGRFFGYLGVIIVDISGLFLIILALTGSAVWLKHKFRSFKRR